MREVVGNGLGVVELGLESEQVVFHLAYESCLVGEFVSPGLEAPVAQVPLLLEGLTDVAQLRKVYI